MKLEKLRTLREELAGEFGSASIDADVFYFFEDAWHRLDDTADLSPQETTSLERAGDDEVAYHAPKSRLAWFACPSINCVVSLHFPSSPKLKTRRQSRERLEQVIVRASNAYSVAHNQLTQLLAKDAFHQRLQLAIETLKQHASPLMDDLLGIEQQHLAAVFALDIDHFKQVNDSHGHLYGDQVLKVFAMRLERTSQDWKPVERDALEVYVGHPSGEEFLVLVVGAVEQQGLLEFGDLLLKAISGGPLPNEAEWASLAEEDNLSMLVPPALHERTITTSIGLATYSPAATEESVRDLASRLLDEADTALYRAKAGGRNQVITYGDILSSCGRVLEHDLGTRIIAIDIGKNVGVTIGQEFQIFPPGYTGTTKFQINDGRSTRTIGTYPRFNLTRITTFDVQPEIAFAFISDPDDRDLSIEVGSHLEAIPLGSIGHLLPHASKYLASSMDGVRVGDIDDAMDFVVQNHDTNPCPYAVVIRFSHANQYLRKYGPAALHAALARLFRGATSTFHAAAAVGLLDSASIVIVGRGHAYSEEPLTTFVNRLASELPELGLVGGVFCDEDLKRSTAEDGNALSAEHAIEFAQFAASDSAMSGETRVTHFSYTIAARILSAQRDARAYSQARADFDKLRSLGVGDARFFNLGGLIYSALREREKSAELFETAARQSDLLVFKSNFATTAETAAQRERAAAMLDAVSDEDIESLKERHPYGLLCYARLMAQAKLDSPSSFNAARFSWVAPLVLSLPEPRAPAARATIEKALE